MEVAEKQNIQSSAVSGRKPKKSKTSQAKKQDKYGLKFEELLKSLAGYAQDPKADLLKKAFRFASAAHKEQLRKSGHPYIEHCLETAKILCELRMDPTTVAAGLLHDVIEDTGVSVDEVEEKFGREIAQLVDDKSQQSFWA